MWLLAGPLTPMRTSQDHHIISWIENMCATTDAWGAHLLRLEAVLLDELYLTSPWDVRLLQRLVVCEGKGKQHII